MKDPFVSKARPETRRVVKNSPVVCWHRDAADGPVRLCWALLLTLLALSSSWAESAEPRRLTFDGQVKTAPVFVEGGKALVYSAQTRFNQLTLRRIPVDVNDVASKATPETLHPSATTSELSPAYSKDEQVFSYIRNNGNLHVALVIEDRAAAQTREVDPGGGFAGIQYATVAPNGKRIAFAFPERGGGQQIWEIGVDGQDKRALTSESSFDSCPAYSPDGRLLAFASTRSGNFDIQVMTLPGGVINPVTSHRGIDLHPSWSPDGRRIAYTSLRGGNYDVFVVDADTAPPLVDTADDAVIDLESNVPDPQAVRVTTHAERDDYPTWHPAGRHLVTVSERNGRHDLYLWEVRPQ